jgi:hypothetical protein
VDLPLHAYDCCSQRLQSPCSRALSLALNPLFDISEELIAHRREEVKILGRYVNICQETLLLWQDRRETNIILGDSDEALDRGLERELSFACDERQRVRSSIIDLEDARKMLSEASNEVCTLAFSSETFR